MPRHVAYIRQDWLDELGMDMPKTKEELGEYLYAVKEAKLGGDNTIPWAMSGRTDTTEDGMKADVANGRAGFVLGDATQPWILSRY